MTPHSDDEPAIDLVRARMEWTVERLAGFEAEAASFLDQWAPTFPKDDPEESPLATLLSYAAAAWHGIRSRDARANLAGERTRIVDAMSVDMNTWIETWNRQSPEGRPDFRYRDGWEAGVVWAIEHIAERGTATRVYPPEPTEQEWAAHAGEDDETPALQARLDAIRGQQ